MPLTIYSLPLAPAARSSTFGPDALTQVFESPLARTRQSASLPGTLWRVSLSYPRMGHAVAVKWQGFFLDMNGRAGRFYGYDPDHVAPAGTITGNPTVLIDGAGQTGSTVNLRDIVNGTTILEGDYLAWDLPNGMRELHMARADVTAAGGVMTVPIKPPIRVSPDDGETVILSYPSCVMQLDDDYQSWDANHASRFGFTITATEALVPDAS